MTDTHLHDSPAAAPQDPVELGIDGFSFADLHDAGRLADLKSIFDARLAEADPELSAKWRKHADGLEPLTGPAEGEILIAVGRHLSAFLAQMFGIGKERDEKRTFLDQRNVVYRLPREFHKRLVRKVAVPEGVDAEEVRRRAAEWIDLLPGMEGVDADEEERLAGCVLALGERGSDERALDGGESTPGTGDTVLEVLELLALDVKLRMDAGDPEVLHWRSIQTPGPMDFEAGLVPLVRTDADNPDVLEGPVESRRMRDGFKLTDDRATVGEVLTEIDRCVFCHEREKDSCSIGLLDKKTQKPVKNPVGIELGGCPLDERISEMHLLYGEGDPIAALAMIMIDNPMVPGTGHRICNDCMKACIFQKTDPVNIPQAETRVLTDALEFRYGPEIYLLLTRWNPLRVDRPFPLPYNGLDVLVVGMGPAGYTLAHYLCMEGFGVVGVDGLKVEPLPDHLVGTSPSAVKRYADLKEELDERVLLGFGGVSEYGITVRWDKNFLTLCYLSLLRREHYALHGGTRFGGTVELQDVWELGFDHVAIATGAGKPTIVKMKNNLSRGIRKASDFLMALQLTGAFKREAFANLQLTLPAIVIGGGLTGIDTATEALAYYPVQVEKLAGRYDTLCQRFEEEVVRRFFTDEEIPLLDEMIGHGRAIAAERERARLAGVVPEIVSLVRSWGGVKLVYRKKLADSPAYRLNHEEVIKALEEGITFVECHSPVEAKLDKFGAVNAMVFEKQKLNDEGKWRGTEELIEMPARTVLVAAGTSPNVIYEKEHPGTFQMDEWKWFFEMYRHSDDDGLEPVARGKDDDGIAFFTSYDDGDHTVSVYGDNHPVYAGNVVKAMASAKQGYPHVVHTFRDRLLELEHTPEAIQERNDRWQQLSSRLEYELEGRVHEVNRLTPTITEIVVHAPAAARKFHPGQFYRLQDFETDARRIEGTKLTMEGIALTGAWKDDERGLLGMIVLEMGVSSRLCALLEKGQRVVVMGPTGAPTEIPTGEKVILLGGGLGNAVLFSIGKALRDKGNEVVYFAGFKRGEDLFKREEIEAASDVVVWSTDAGIEIEPARTRPFDVHFRGNIVQAMLAYANGEFGEVRVDLEECDRIIVIGSDRMMNAVKGARFGVMADHLKAGHLAIGSINSPMQCMMKEICAQCLCRHVDPDTGVEVAPVFSCFNQDQPLDCVDFDNLNQRLRQNTVQEKLANLWLDHIVHEGDLPIWTTL